MFININNKLHDRIFGLIQDKVDPTMTEQYVHVEGKKGPCSGFAVRFSNTEKGVQLHCIALLGAKMVLDYDCNCVYGTCPIENKTKKLCIFIGSDVWNCLLNSGITRL